MKKTGMIMSGHVAQASGSKPSSALNARSGSPPMPICRACSSTTTGRHRARAKSMDKSRSTGTRSVDMRLPLVRRRRLHENRFWQKRRTGPASLWTTGPVRTDAACYAFSAATSSAGASADSSDASAPTASSTAASASVTTSQASPRPEPRRRRAPSAAAGFAARCFGVTGSSTSSMTAMGALSPLRLPIFVMRV